jgi:hypothetical protein
MSSRQAEVKFLSGALREQNAHSFLPFYITGFFLYKEENSFFGYFKKNILQPHRKKSTYCGPKNNFFSKDFKLPVA